MGIIAAGVFVSLDGVYQGPGAPDEDREGGFELGGWTAPLTDEETGERIGAATFAGDALLLGRKTYDGFAAYWPSVPDDDPFGRKLNATPKYVVSRTIETADWANTTVVRGDDIPARIAALKDRHERLGVTGSGNLLQTLLRHDLVDELTLFVYPVLLGSGKRLFGPDLRPAAFEVIDSATSKSGVAVQTYRRAGDVQLASAV